MPNFIEIGQTSFEIGVGRKKLFPRDTHTYRHTHGILTTWVVLKRVFNHTKIASNHPKKQWYNLLTHIHLEKLPGQYICMYECLSENWLECGEPGYVVPEASDVVKLIRVDTDEDEHRVDDDKPQERLGAQPPQPETYLHSQPTAAGQSVNSVVPASSSRGATNWCFSLLAFKTPEITYILNIWIHLLYVYLRGSPSSVTLQFKGFQGPFYKS